PAVTSSTCTGDDVPMVPEALGPPPSASGPTSTPDAGGRRMDEDTPSRRSRATAGASALGATALLVLSFGPSALALSPASPTPQPLRAPTSATAPAAPTASAPTAAAVSGSAAPTPSALSRDGSEEQEDDCQPRQAGGARSQQVGAGPAAGRSRLVPAAAVSPW